MVGKGLKLVESVFFLADDSPGCGVAFAHALAIALAARASLTIVHAGRPADDWREFPAVRGTLERWGLLRPGSPQAAVFEALSVRVKKVQLDTARPLAAVMRYLGEDPSDLIVAATDKRGAMPGITASSVSEGAAQRSGAMALFVPEGARGFVGPEDGSLSLRRILVPVAPDPDPQLAVDGARRVARVLGTYPVEITLLHVGEGPRPDVTTPGDLELRFRSQVREGEVVPGILAAAADADLIVMTTNGRSSLAEMLRGSHTERTVRGASCPVLSLPESWGGLI